MILEEYYEENFFRLGNIMKVALLFFINCFVFAASAGNIPSNIPDKITLKRDARPAGGILTVLTLTKNKTSVLFSGALRTAYYSRRDRVEIDETKTLADSMSCILTKQGATLTEMTCTHDSRPYDGSLVEIAIERNDAGGYNSVLHKNFFSKMEHKNIDTVETLGINLEISM